MSQFQGAYTDPYNQAIIEPPRTSGLAVTALVFSLIICCPLTTLLGPLLGLIAFVSIGSNPAKKGKGLAIAAIIIGLLATVGWGIIVSVGYSAYKTFEGAPGELVRAGYDGDFAKFKAGFGTAGVAASDAEAKAFIDELNARYGRVTRSELDLAAFQQMQQGGSQVMGFPYRMVFQKETLNVEMQFDPQAQQQQKGKSDEILFESITVRDSALGDLTFPPGAQPPPAGPSPRGRGRGTPPPPATTQDADPTDAPPSDGG